MERPAILNRSMPRTPDAVIGFPAPRTTNVSVPKTKIYEANLHSFKGLQKKYSRCRAECEGQMNTIFEDTVDFRSCGPQLFNHKVKLPPGPVDTDRTDTGGCPLSTCEPAILLCSECGSDAIATSEEVIFSYDARGVLFCPECWPREPPEAF